MSFNDAAMVVGANAIKAAVLYAQIHSADPGPSGTANVNSGATRQAISWSATTADGDFGLSAALTFTGMTANVVCSHLSLWSASTSGTYYGAVALTGDTQANASGQFTVSALNANGSSS